MKIKKTYKFIIAIIISLTLMYFLMKDIPFETLKEFSKNVSPIMLVITFIIYSIMNLFRAIRLKRIFSKIRFSKLIGIVFIHNMINNILPFRIGEFSYLYMIKKEKNTSHAVSSLIMLRLSDIIAVVLIFGAALIFIDKNSVVNKIFLSSIILIIVILTLMIIITKFEFLKFKKIKKIRDIISLLKKYDAKKIINLIIDSLVIWILSFLFYHVFAVNMNIKLGFFEIIVACVIIIFSSILPINGLAGFGTVELSWTIGLLLFGVDKTLAITSGLIIHLARILFFVALGLVGLIIRKITFQQHHHHPE